MNDEWQVGKLLDPQEIDAKYECDLKAINAAIDLSAHEPDEVFAVWKNVYPEWIFVGGEQYRRM